ncbi:MULTISPECIES: hypothetical protein [unclassified Streptomyces]|uniref:hypothetical protein n=1 Tax=unclassified Streptomyces TaxID=2593676 RepID=UPI0033A68111
MAAFRSPVAAVQSFLAENTLQEMRMRHTHSAVRPARRRGLYALALLALLAFLHTTFSTCASHLTVLEPDGCRQQAVSASDPRCQATPSTAVAGPDAERHHQHSGGAQSRSASAYGRQQLGAPPHAAPAVDAVRAAPGTASTATWRGTSGSGNIASAPGSVVLRC